MGNASPWRPSFALVRGIVELHGGSVTARSEGPGKGSEFVVRLPASGPPRLIPIELLTERIAGSVRLRL